MPAEQAGATTIPDSVYLLTAQFSRKGTDLILTGTDGAKHVVPDYFAKLPVDLMTEKGATLGGETVRVLAGPMAPMQIAQAAGASVGGAQPIGKVSTADGSVKIVHANGVEEAGAPNTEIFLNDTVITAGNSSVGVVFIDKTTFALGANGRMVIDNFVYSGKDSKALFSVVQGTFSFVSGQVAKAGPDVMQVKLPTMTIGIRGTKVAGFAATEGEQSQVTLLRNDDGSIGEIFVSNKQSGFTISVANFTAFTASGETAFQAPALLVNLSKYQDAMGALSRSQDRSSLELSPAEQALERLNEIQTGSGGQNQLGSIHTFNDLGVIVIVTQTADGPVAIVVAIPTAQTTSDAPPGDSTTISNHSPTIGNSDVTTNEDNQVAGVMNGQDPDGDPLKYSVTQVPLFGTVVMNTDGTFVYKPGVLMQTLAIGETVIDKFVVAVNDGRGGSAAKEVFVTINGVNDAPAINDGASDFNGGVKEITDGAPGENATTLSDTGTVSFSDIDASDTHTVTALFLQGVNSGDAGDTAQRGSLAITVSNDSTNIFTGTVSWIFTVPDSALDNLGEGQTFTETYRITVSDGHGGTVTRDITIVLTEGTNDVPTIGTADVGGGVTERADNNPSGTNPTENTGNLTDTGTINFADVDLIDTHLVARTLVSAVDSATGLTTAARGDISPVITDGSTSDGAGVVTWTYTVAAGALDDLAQGQTITQVYTITVTDSDGASVSRDVTVVLTGTNDAPVITVDAGAGDSAATPLTETNTTLAVFGTLSVSDIDRTDVVTPSVTGVVASEVTTGLLSDNTALLSFFSVSPDPVIDGTSQTGTLTWDFDSGSEAFDYLADGEQLVLTYTIQVQDDSGVPASDDQIVTITITGTNDAPVITVDAGAGDSAATPLTETNTTLAVFGTLSVSDIDRTDVVTPSVTGVVASEVTTGLLSDNTALLSFFSVSPDPVIDGTSQTGTLTWDFDSGSEAFDYLADGEQLVLTYTIQVQDDSGVPASDDQIVTITITGSDETFIGGPGADSLTGTGGRDTIQGLGGNDTLTGAGGNDLLQGGDDTDTASYTGTLGAVVVDLSSNTATGTAGNDTLSDIENVVGAGFADTLTGDAAVNVLDGAGGDDTLSGAAGNDTLSGDSGNDTLLGGDNDDLLIGGANGDTLSGGAGNNTASYAASASVTVDLTNTGSQTGGGHASGDVLTNIQNLIGSSNADILTGDGSVNVLDGAGGNDTLQGGDGADTLIGGSGNDTIIGASDDALLDGDDNTDTLQVAGGFTSTGEGQITGIEIVTLTSAGVLNLANQGEGFTITGSSGNDTITGGAGADNFSGGVGNDTIIGAQNDQFFGGGSNTDTLQVAGGFTSTGNSQINEIEVVALTSAGALNLSNQSEDYTLVGSSGVDTITGGSVNDTIFGASNDATLDGGDGTDTLNVAAGFTSASNAQIVNIERVTLTSAGILNLSNQTENGITLTGSSGADSITGGGGNDTIVGAQNDLLLDGVGGDSDVLLLGANFTSTGNGQIVNIETVQLAGGTVFDLSDQTEGFTIVVQNPSGVTVTGGSGADRMLGVGGNDTFIGAQNDLTFSGGDGTDTLLIGANFNDINDSQIQTIEIVTLTVAATLNLESQTENLTINGTSGNDVITGGAGADSISAGDGDDTIILANTNVDDSLLDGGGGTDTLQVAFAVGIDSSIDANIVNIEAVTLTVATILTLSDQTEAFTITGSSGADTITGGSAADSIDGGAGADSISGGAGNDTIIGAQDDALLDGGNNIDTLQVGANFTSTGNAQIVFIENVTLTAAVALNLLNQTDQFNITGSSGDDTITGSSASDSISGGAGNDTIFGGGEDATLDGGADTDTLSLGNTGDFSGAADAKVVNIENVVLTNAITLNLALQTEGFTITGSTGAENITGGTAADTIDGAAGADELTGGGGNDTIIGAQNDILLDGGADNDTLNVGATFISTGEGQITGIEIVTLTSAGVLNLTNQTEGFTITGSSGADTITGSNTGGDTIAGGAGADALTGGGGIDTADYSASSLGVTVDLTLAAQAGLGDASGDVLSQIENVTGSSHDDTLTGDEGDNILSGGGDGDTLIGLGGADTLIGGDTGGGDFADYSSSAAAVTVNLNLTETAQISGGDASGDVLSGIEHVFGSNLVGSADTLTGDAGDNRLFGLDGDDTLIGGAGNDQLRGGSGNDVLDGGGGNDSIQYTGATTEIVVTLDVNGAGTVVTGSGTDTFTNIENVTGGTGNDTLTGNSDANVLSGGGGADSLIGGDGNDTLIVADNTFAMADGGGDNDTLAFDGSSIDLSNVDRISSIETIDMGGSAKSLTISAAAVLDNGPSPLQILGDNTNTVSLVDFGNWSVADNGSTDIYTHAVDNAKIEVQDAVHVQAVA